MRCRNPGGTEDDRGGMRRDEVRGGVWMRVGDTRSGWIDEGDDGDEGGRRRR